MDNFGDDRGDVLLPYDWDKQHYMGLVGQCNLSNIMISNMKGILRMTRIASTL